MRNVSFDILPGTMVAIIGANGAGKTTLLNALAGLLPAHGEIIYDGESLVGRDIEERVENGLCLVPERRELFSTMSVEDNLRLGAYARPHDHLAYRNRLTTSISCFPRLAERTRNRRRRDRADDRLRRAGEGGRVHPRLCR